MGAGADVGGDRGGARADDRLAAAAERRGRRTVGRDDE